MLHSLKYDLIKIAWKFTRKKGLIGWQPTVNTHSSLIVDGVPYDRLHIVNIKSTPNNTIMTLTDHKGTVLFMTSAVNFWFDSRLVVT